MAKIEPANLLLTDKDGNTGLVKSLTNKDITTLKNVVTNVDYIKDFINANGGSLPVQGDLKLTATDAAGKNGKTLLGTSNGILQWNNKNVIRSVNNIEADVNGNVQLGNLVAIPGEIKYFAFNTPPDGYLVCNGAEISRETYADLFAVIGTTFGSGDGSTTFNIPDLRDRYIIGANTNALGTQIAEQLPNIKGGVESDVYGHLGAGSESTRQSGAITYIEKRSARGNIGTSASNVTSFTFNAHNSNSIYTDNGHVYPLSLALLPCIKY